MSTPQNQLQPTDVDLDSAVEQLRTKFKVPRALVDRMVRQESGGNTNAVSPKDARGRFQLTLGTVDQINRETGKKLNIDDPLDNAYAGLYYLRQNYDRFRKGAPSERGAWMRSVAAYHAGPGNVESDLRRGGLGIPDVGDGLINTRDHVANIFEGTKPEDFQDQSDIEPALKQLTASVNRRTARIQPQRPARMVAVDPSLPQAFQQATGSAGGARQHLRQPVGMGDVQQASRTRFPTVAEARHAEEEPIGFSAQGQPSRITQTPDELRVMKGEQPVNRQVYSRQQDAQARLGQMRELGNDFDPKKEEQWHAANSGAIQRQTDEFRKEIKNSRTIGGDASAWLAEFGKKTRAGLSELGAGITGSDELRIQAEAAARAAAEEGADRNLVSKFIQDAGAGFISSAPELAAMKAGVNPALVFGVGSALRAGGSGRDPNAAAVRGAGTGLAFELSGVGEGAKRILTKAANVGAQSGLVDLAAGASPREALVSGATNAAMVGTELAGGRKNARQAETRRLEQPTGAGVLVEQGRERGTDNINQGQGSGTPNTEPAQRFQHLQFGEVEVLPDQTGANRGRIKVAEVGDPSKIHFVKKSDMQGRGNARMIPIKESPSALPVEPAASPETVTPEVEPLVREGEKPSLVEAFHGTRKGFEDFQIPEGDTRSPRGLGAWFSARSDSPAYEEGNAEYTAEVFAGERPSGEFPEGANVRKVELDIRKPAEFEDYDDLREAMLGKTAKQFREELQAQGHDGIVIRGSTTDGGQYRDDWIAFSSEQVSLAGVSKSELKGEQQIAPPLPLESGARESTQNVPRDASRDALQGERLPASTTSAKRESVTADREGRGEEAIPKPERKADKQLHEDALEANAKDPTEPIRLVDQVLNGSKQLSDMEVVQVDLHRQDLKNKYDAVNKELDAATDPTKVAEMSDRADVMERQMRAAEEASATSNTATARALRAARIEVDQDFRLLTMVSKAIRDRKRPLTTAERETIKAQHAEIESLNEKVAKSNERAEQLEAQLAVKRIQREVTKESRGTVRKEKKASLDDEFAQLAAQAAQAWKKGHSSGVQPMGLSEFDVELGKIVMKMARNRVQKGTVNAGGLVDEIHGLLKDAIDIDKRQVRDMISGYGRPKETRSQLQKKIDALKSELYTMSSKEDVEVGTRSPKSEGPRLREAPRQGPRLTEAPKQGPTLSEGVGKHEGPELGPRQGPKEREGWRSTEGPRLTEGTNPKAGPKITDAPKLGPRDTLPTYRKRIESQIDLLQKKIDTGDFSKAEQRGPTVYDSQTLALQRRLEQVKRDYFRANYKAVRGRFGQITDELAKAANVPKTIKSMGDVSAMFRQGGFYSLTHPIQGLAKPTRDMLRSFSESGYRNVENAIKNHPKFEQAKRDGVEFTGADKADPVLSNKEEGYFGGETIDLLATGKYNPLRAVKGVKNFSERTFVSFLDSQRMHMYDTMTEGLTDPGIIRRTLGQKATTRGASPQDFKEIAKLINVGTGRGDIPRFLGGNKAAPFLNILMFSPRLVASRVQMLNNMVNPVKMARMPAGARNQMIADNVRFLAATAAVMQAARMAGGTVNTDPDDGDFLKIRLGKTTYDTLTGLQQPLRYIINMTRAATGGETYPGKSAWEQTVGDKTHGGFLESKSSPLAGAVAEQIRGTDFTGRKRSIRERATDLITPLPVKDLVDAMQKEGLLAGAVKAVPTVTGIGVQTYDNIPEPKTTAEKLARKLGYHPGKQQTDEEIDKGKKLADLRRRSRKGEDVSDELESVGATERQSNAILDAKNKTQLQENVNPLGAKEALIVYSAATPEQRETIRAMIQKKATTEKLAEKTTEDAAEIRARMRKLGIQELTEFQLPAEPLKPVRRVATPRQVAPPQ